MKNKFIKLKKGDKCININAMMICSIKQGKNKCVVTTMDGSVHKVEDTEDEVLNMIEKSENYTLTTKKK